MAEAFYQIKFPGFPYDFAHCLVRSEPTSEPCSDCGCGAIAWEPPLQIQWDKESPEVAGDFTPFFPAPNNSILVSDRVRRAIEPQFQELEFHPIEELPGRRGKSRVQYRPDPGPLWWLKPFIVHIDPKRYRWTP
jgi:hypothetical protein